MIMQDTFYCTDCPTVTYDNDFEYRVCLRKLFSMKPVKLTCDDDIDEVSRDENDYDGETTSKGLDFIYESTKDNVYFQKLYDAGASKMLSENREIGLAVLFSYDYMKYFHSCVVDYLEDPVHFDDSNKSYVILYKKIV